MSDLEIFRSEKDDFFGSHPQSPLTREQKQTFKNLNYFDENPALRLEVKPVEFSEKERIQMQTTTGDVQTYERFGRFQFTVDGQAAELTIFQGPHGFFL